MQDFLRKNRRGGGGGEGGCWQHFFHYYLLIELKRQQQFCHLLSAFYFSSLMRGFFNYYFLPNFKRSIWLHDFTLINECKNNKNIAGVKEMAVALVMLLRIMYAIPN